MAAIFVNRPGRKEHSLERTAHICFLLSFGSFGQAVSEEKIFRNQPIRNKNCLWWPCLLADRDKMSILYRGPSIDASYPVSVHLAKRFQRRRILKNQPIRNKNRQWCSCLLTDRDELSKLYKGPFIDASSYVSDHLANRFQKRRILEIDQSETKIACGGHVCQWTGTK